MIGVYVLTDVRTNKFYVGSAGDLEKRIHQHFTTLKHNNHANCKLQDLWNSGASLVISQFPTETREEAFELEKDIICRNLNSDIMLNIGMDVKGGDNVTRNPNRDSILAKIKASVIERVKALTPLERKMLHGQPGKKNGMYGRTHTPEARQRISEAHKGNAYCLGLKRSEKQRKFLSELAKSRTGSLNPFFGKHHTSEARDKISKAVSARSELPGNSRRVSIDGVEYESVTDASRKLGVSPALIVHRLKSQIEKYATYLYIDKSPTTSESTVDQNSERVA